MPTPSLNSSASRITIALSTLALLLAAALGGAIRPLAAQATSATAPESAADSSPSAASADERWQISLGPDDYVWDVRLVKIDGDRLIVRQVDSLVRVPIAKITEMRLIRKSEMQIGTAAGGAMGALMGSDDEVYDLSPLDPSDKLRALQKIFLYHPATAAP